MWEKKYKPERGKKIGYGDQRGWNWDCENIKEKIELIKQKKMWVH